MRKCSFFIFLLCLFSIFIYSEGIRILNERNLFSEDEGERESLYSKYFDTMNPMFGSVSISPDGKKVAIGFSCLKDGCPFTIAVANIDGSDAKIISDKEDIGPVWSPDSKKIAFHSLRSGDRPEIFIMNPDGTDQRQLTYGGGVDPTWSPEGTRIAFVRKGNIFIVKIDGTGLTQVTSWEFGVFDLVWSPDGTKIAFVSHRYGKSNIWIINPDGTGLQQITFGGAFSPCWSHDSRWIIFSVEATDREPYDALYAKNIYTNETILLRKVAPWEEGEGGVSSASISSDGRKIVYLLGAGEKEGIYIADLDFY